MFEQLPGTIKDKILYHLTRNEFPQAKSIYDQYTRQLAQKKSPAQATQPTGVS